MSYDQTVDRMDRLQAELDRLREDAFRAVDAVRSDLDNLASDLRRFGEPR